MQGKQTTMSRSSILGILWLALSGCIHPIHVVTDDHVRVDAAATVVPTSNADPIVAMPVEGGACNKSYVAIVDVDGLLLNSNPTGPYAAGDNAVDLFREKLDTAARDPHAVALVVRINSPGGSVTATDIMWRELQCFRDKTQRPVVACLMDLGTGGAYYLATASDRIVAHPTTVTGGIGVLLNLYNLEDLMNTFNVTMQSIKAGAKIDIGTVTEALSPESQKILQGIADELHERFRTVVHERRPAVKMDDATIFDGRIFSASQALQRGLIDKVGYLQDALSAARELAGQPQAGAALLHRCHDVARTPFATTPNVPLQFNGLPFSFPGLDRSKLPTFLYMWQPDPTLERLSGK